MKNGNGTGNIFKLKDKRRKPWVARVTTGYSIDGKQIRKVVGTFETKREAQIALLEYSKNPKLYSNKTFKEIKELWWNMYKSKVDNPNTIKTNIYRLRALSTLDIIVIFTQLKIFIPIKIPKNLEKQLNYCNNFCCLFVAY